MVPPESLSPKVSPPALTLHALRPLLNPICARTDSISWSPIVRPVVLWLDSRSSCWILIMCLSLWVWAHISCPWGPEVLDPIELEWGSWGPQRGCWKTDWSSGTVVHALQGWDICPGWLGPWAHHNPPACVLGLCPHGVLVGILGQAKKPLPFNLSSL